VSRGFHRLEPVAAFVVGLVFAAGLVVSGMADPAKVKGFLDLAGAWDPSLAFVMAGAIAVGLFGYRRANPRSKSWLGLPMRLSTSRAIDARVLAGGALFGIGWGLAGFCPGPALVALASGLPAPWIFVAAMLGGMALYEIYEVARKPR